MTEIRMRRMEVLVDCILGIGICLELGIWLLEFNLPLNIAEGKQNG